MTMLKRSLLFIITLAVAHSAALADMNSTIVSQGHCGFTQANSFFFLINGNPKASLRITVRTTWRSGIRSGQSDRVYELPPGGRQALGCGDSGSIPVTYYRFQIVGEQRTRHWGGEVR